MGADRLLIAEIVVIPLSGWLTRVFSTRWPFAASAARFTLASLLCGPVIGGSITDTWNWHWLFYVNLLPGIAVTILAGVLIRIDEPDLSLLKGADYLGIVLMAVALSTLEYVLEEGSRWNWFDSRSRTFRVRRASAAPYPEPTGPPGAVLSTRRSGIARGSRQSPACCSSLVA